MSVQVTTVSRYFITTHFIHVQNQACTTHLIICIKTTPRQGGVPYSSWRLEWGSWGRHTSSYTTTSVQTQDSCMKRRQVYIAESACPLSVGFNRCHCWLGWLGYSWSIIAKTQPNNLKQTNLVLGSNARVHKCNSINLKSVRIYCQY